MSNDAQRTSESSPVTQKPAVTTKKPEQAKPDVNALEDMQKAVTQALPAKRATAQPVGTSKKIEPVKPSVDPLVLAHEAGDHKGKIVHFLG